MRDVYGHLSIGRSEEIFCFRHDLEFEGVTEFFLFHF